MPYNTTSIDLTSVVTPVITTATTWAHIRGVSLTDPVDFIAFNASAISVRISGSSAATTASAGMPLQSSAYASYDIRRPADGLFAFTTNSTATIVVQASQ